MRIAWAFVIGLTSTLVTAVVGDLFSEEARTRLEQLPVAVIRFASQWLPADVRDEWTDEWLAELAYILRGTESLPISRLVRGTRFALGHLCSAPAIGRDLGRSGLTIKRAMDVTLAGLGLLAVAPLMVTIAAAIRLSSPGPALFRQLRVGRGQSSFEMLKFRTMSANTGWLTAELPTRSENDGPLFRIGDDPPMTRVGRVLRRLSLDELPQLINVLRGDMSLVGPRPVRPWEVTLYEPHHRARFAVRPGITGWWQVSRRKRMTMQQALDLDVEYVRRRSLLVDLVTLAKTTLVVFVTSEDTATRVGCGVLWYGPSKKPPVIR
jgi:lipopolysaccharide/colanic/teichoic acid biosynthesis glycosyltransferase